MPMKKRSGKTSKRSYSKRYPKRTYRRSRYSKKTQSTNFTPTKNVKLKWAQKDRLSTTAGSDVRACYIATSIAPDASPSSTDITNGSQYYAGVAEYASIYSQYIPLGAKINVRLINETAKAMRVLLLPFVTSELQNQDDDDENTINDALTELDSLSFDEVASLPGAMVKLIGHNNGGNSDIVMNMYRSTRGMLKIKDLEDFGGQSNTSHGLRLDMPYLSGLDANGIPTFAEGEQNVYNSTSWFYYLRVSAVDVAQAIDTYCETTMHLYAKLMNRRLVISETSAVPADNEGVSVAELKSKSDYKPVVKCIDYKTANLQEKTPVEDKEEDLIQ